jgi:hypothetical protein
MSALSVIVACGLLAIVYGIFRHAGGRRQPENAGNLGSGA